MMTLNANKQKMYYALQDKEIPIYETDENGNIIYYVDEDGNKIALKTGETKPGYSNPKSFKGNIAMSGGESQAVEFGINTSEYEAVLLIDKNAKNDDGELIKIKEGSLIWFESEPKKTAEGDTDEFSADYKVIKPSPSLNTVRYVLKKVVK